MNFTKKNATLLALLLVPAALSLNACGALPGTSSDLDRSAEKTAATSEDGVANGLLPRWVPASGTDVKLEQRSTGAERLFVMDYDRPFSSEQCLTVKSAGQPTDRELAEAYAADDRFKGFEAKDISSTRTLSADWWPADAQSKTQWLCGRFWVHQSDGKLYAFSPDTQTAVDGVLRERKDAKQS